MKSIIYQILVEGDIYNFLYLILLEMHHREEPVKYSPIMKYIYADVKIEPGKAGWEE